MEAGFNRGDKLVVCVDQDSSAESLVAQFGAIKAGVTVVCVNEKDSKDALDHAISSTGAKGLIFSPDTELTGDISRRQAVEHLMPELAKSYLGDEVKLGRYPHLEHVVQVGHQAMRGVNRFRDISVYAVPRQTPYQLPENHPDEPAFLCLKDGREHATHTNEQLVSKAGDLWEHHMREAATSSKHPVFIACDMNSPFGLTAFLACSSNL